MKLSYPITRDYPWRYFTTTALALSAIVLAVLTVVNVVAVGYETITVIREDFNATQTHWWMPFFPKRKPTCDAHQFNYGNTFFTNVSVFEYSIPFIEGSQGFSYSAAPLGATCSFIYYFLKVDGTQQSVTGTAGLTCHGNNNATMDIWSSYVTHTLVDARSFWKPSTLAGRIVLDLLAYDLLFGMRFASTTTAIDNLEAGAVACDGFGHYTNISITPAQAAACANGPVPLFITDVTFTYANGSYNGIAPSLATESVPGLPETLAESIPNYLRALSAAIFMDMGIWKNNSIFASPDMFNATITPNSAVNRIFQNGSSQPSAALLLRANPSPFLVPVESRTPAVIAMSYLCHDQRRKSVFSLIVSVFVADVSMFAAFWAAFMTITSYFASQEALAIDK